MLQKKAFKEFQFQKKKLAKLKRKIPFPNF
jgi:hypothetical protein